jgi:hypothetical protein
LIEKIKNWMRERQRHCPTLAKHQGKAGKAMGPFAANLPSFHAGAVLRSAPAFARIVRTDPVVAPARSGAIMTAIQTTARREQAGKDTILALPDRTRRTRSQLERLGECWVNLNRHLL